MPESILIIGAGVGGLAAAIRLAKAGYEVTVLEQNPQVGGSLRQIRAGGFRWDLLPWTLVPRPPLEALFQHVDRSLRADLRPREIEAPIRYVFADGTTFERSRDWVRTAAEIARINPGDVAGCLRYLAFAADLHRLRQHGFGRRSRADRAPSRLSPIKAWLRAAPFQSVYGASARFIRAEKLRRAFAHCATLAGGSPYAMSSAHSALAHTHWSGGVWQPRNGLFAIALALEKLAAEHGVKIRLNCPVRQIQIEGKRATGVMLERRGETLRAHAVVSNLGAIPAARRLLPQRIIAAPLRRSLAQTPMSASAFVMLLGIRGTFPQLSHHNIYFSADGKREYDQIFRQEIMPDDPTITITISSKTDGLSAPANQENWLIQAPAPPLSEKFDWARGSAAVRDRILAVLAQRHGLDLRDKIRVEKHLTPADLQQLTGAWRGALSGELPHGRRAALATPQIRSRHVSHLYHVGGSVLPGGGIAQALLSAQLLPALINEDLR